MTLTLLATRCDHIDWYDDVVAGDRYCLIHQIHFNYPYPCPAQLGRTPTKENHQ